MEGDGVGYTKRIEKWMEIQKSDRIYELGSLPPFLLVFVGHVAPIEHKWNLMVVEAGVSPLNVSSIVFFTGRALSKPGDTPEAPLDQTNIEELLQRMKLLQENSELQKLHKEFVGGGVLTEVEFWATRKKLLDGNLSRKSKQQTGLKSTMLLDKKLGSQ